MDASPKRNAMVLQFLHYMKACTLIFSLNFKTSPSVWHTCAHWMRPKNFLLRGHEERRQKCLEFLFVDQVFFLHRSTASMGQIHTKKSHGVRSLLGGGHPAVLAAQSTDQKNCQRDSNVNK